MPRRPFPNPLRVRHDAEREAGFPAEPAGPDDLDWAQRRRRTVIGVGALTLTLLVTLPLAVGIGPVGIAPGTVTAIVGHHVLGAPAEVAWAPTEDAIVWRVRFPRVLLGVVVGAALAVTGVALQAMVRNVLADPYLLGVSSGASTGAAATILFGVGVGAGSGASTVTATAFLGALAASAAVFGVARWGGQVTAIRLVLAGVAIGYVLSAATSFLIFASDTPEGARAVLFWLLGSLALASWLSLLVPALVVAAVVVLLLGWSRRFDALAIGDDTAHALGVPPARFRVQALAVVALCIGAVVAVSGAIGFVGLVVPHIARYVVGGEHRRLFAVAALIGAILLVWSDVAARIVLQPAELPIGIVTAALGTPFLLALVRRLHTTRA